ncbi:tripartite tricarboxylate transporter substrate binding protein [Paracandidimonas soli]|uniref:tripartite tricarboxylate transporter substrate binding protein n=1 Tax=Paracandidimonas soli TaxID=1917182 RepID=UPI00333FF40E
MKKKLGIAVGVLSLCGMGPGQASAAANFPVQPINIVVPSSPGGAIDMVARLVAKQVGQKHGVNMVVSNKPGATGIVGSDYVAKSAPDGHTILLASSAHSINPSMTKLPYDTLTAFAPVVLTHSVPLMLVVTDSLPVNNVQELISYARQNPGTLSFASSGLGGAPHLSGELFKHSLGLDILHVPYRGSTLAHADLVSGRTHLMFDTLAALRAPLDGKRLKPLAVTTKERAASDPDIPTMQEAGVAGYETETWGGILAPAGTPPDVVEKLNAWINEALQEPEVRDQLTRTGIVVRGGASADFDTFIRDEMVKWGKVASDAGIEPKAMESGS